MSLLSKNRLLAFAAAFVILQILIAVAATWLAPYDPMAQSVAQRLRGPSALHWLGTDQLGRDVLARILYGYRTSLAACALAVGVALVTGGALGLLAAYYRGWLDRILMRCMDVLFAFPVMLLAIGVISVLGPHTSSAAIAIAVVYTPIFARLMRGPALVIMRKRVCHRRARHRRLGCAHHPATRPAEPLLASSWFRRACSCRPRFSSRRRSRSSASARSRRRPRSA